MKKNYIKAFLLSTLFAAAIQESAVAQVYCTATNTSSTSYYIASVTTTGGLTNINNPATTFSTNGYADYTTMSASAFQGNSFTLNAQAGPSGYTYMWNVWLDWNHDGDFNDPGENVYTISSYVSSITTTITVPVTSALGPTRMRIRDAFISPAPPACGTNTWGEAEDYTLNVIAMPPTDNAAMGSLQVPDGTPFCANSDHEVAMSVINMGSNAISSVTINWTFGGVLQTPVVCTTPLAGYSDSTTVTLGYPHFPTNAPVPIVAWVSNPNGVPDNDNDDDSTTTSAAATLEGVDVHISPRDTTICQGTSILLDAGEYNLNPIYIWSTGSLNQSIDVAQAGMYTVKVMNTLGCFDRDTVNVTVHPDPTANSISIIDNGSGSFTFNVIGAQNITSYVWDFGDMSATVPGSGIPNQQLHTFAPGTYTVTLTLTNDCNTIVLTRLVLIENTTGIDNISDLQKSFRIYPNPGKTTVAIAHTGDVKMTQVEIFSLLGQKVYSSAVKTDKHMVDVSAMSAGIYNVVITTPAGNITKKLEVIK